MISLSRRNGGSRSGFTLIELLVVVGIIVLLAAILTPAIGHAYKVAVRTRMAADLQVISQALNAYKSDFGDYPRFTTPPGQPVQPASGAVLLSWALLAPGNHTQDGADGPGFRTRGITGRVWGPYLPPDRFQLMGYSPARNGGTGAMVPVTSPDDTADLLADRNGNPIFYFPAAKNVAPTAQLLVGKSLILNPPTPTTVFNFGDNSIQVLATQPYWTVQRMQFCMGLTDIKGQPLTAPAPIATGPYLLWSPGPDNFFGTGDDVVDNGQSLQVVAPPGS